VQTKTAIGGRKNAAPTLLRLELASSVYGSRLVAQLINKGQCAVNNSWAGNQWTTAGGGNGCTNPSPDNAMRAIFGYYSCKIIPANPSPAPGPRTALANRLRLVRMYQ